MRQAVTIVALILGAALVATPAVLNALSQNGSPVSLSRPASHSQPASLSSEATDSNMMAAVPCWVVGAIMIAVALLAALWTGLRTRSPSALTEPTSKVA